MYFNIVTNLHFCRFPLVGPLGSTQPTNTSDEKFLFVCVTCFDVFNTTDSYVLHQRLHEERLNRLRDVSFSTLEPVSNIDNDNKNEIKHHVEAAQANLENNVEGSTNNPMRNGEKGVAHWKPLKTDVKLDTKLKANIKEETKMSTYYSNSDFVYSEASGTCKHENADGETSTVEHQRPKRQFPKRKMSKTQLRLSLMSKKQLRRYKEKRRRIKRRQNRKRWLIRQARIASGEHHTYGTRLNVRRALNADDSRPSTSKE